MISMPMTNYEDDLGREQIAAWCDYFNAQNQATKLSLFKQIWALLTSEEQNDVIVDFKLLMGRSSDALSSSTPIEIHPGDDEEAAIANGLSALNEEEEVTFKKTVFSNNA